MKFVVATCLMIALTGCAANSTIMFGQLDQSALAAKIEQSPIVELLGSKSPRPKIHEPSEIELHYKSFNLFNEPDVALNWKYYYVIGPASSPKWKHVDVADISVYQLQRDDQMAIKTIREKASELGGSAVVDLFRKPMLQGVPSEYAPARINGYAYFGRIVRESGR